MKKLFLLLAIASLAICAHAQTASNQYQHILSTWNVPNTTLPNCSASVTTNCLSSYTYTATDPYGHPNIVTVGLASTNGVVSYNFGPGGYLWSGTWNLSVVANYLDSTGATATSSATPAQVVVPAPFVPSPPSGLKGTLQP